ncbi:MAG: hypothetical protein HY242_05830 [Afipia sp.]|nr:hypothetical protein [Afipia sp.]
MAETTYFPRHIILAAATIFGVLLSLAVHILIQRFNLNLGDLWRQDTGTLIPATAAVAWWVLAAASFVAGYFTASLMGSSVEGKISVRMRQLLIFVGVLMLAAAGQAASAPSAVPTLAGVVAGVVALCLGAVMAFCGAHFSLRRT